jgi:cytochrome c peroxidase
MKMSSKHGCHPQNASRWRTAPIGKRGAGTLSALLLCAGIFTAWWASGVGETESQLLEQARQIFEPIRKDLATPGQPLAAELVSLGRVLYFEPRVSLDGTTGCARCHKPELYGTDALERSAGVEGRRNQRNAPTVLNTALQFAQLWDGNRKNVEEQATRSLLGSFGSPDYASAMSKLEALGYGPAFWAAFPGEKQPLTAENWGKAIGAYERTLLTPAPFDAYLHGDSAALSPEAKTGLRKFIALGCSGCHGGVGVGGGMLQKFGLVKDYWLATGSKEIDNGRFEVTREAADRYVFKVPSLRNVAMTPPYFHDGSVGTLDRAVRIMAEVQLGASLSEDDVRALLAFLGSLTGPLPAEFASVPMLPAGTFPPSKP